MSFLGKIAETYNDYTSGDSSPSENSSSSENSSPSENSGETSKRLGGAFWGGLINTAGDLISGFNYKSQENQIEIARLNAAAAKSRENMNKSENMKKYMMIGGVILVVIVVIFTIKRK